MTKRQLGAVGVGATFVFFALHSTFSRLQMMLRLRLNHVIRL